MDRFMQRVGSLLLLAALVLFAVGFWAVHIGRGPLAFVLCELMALVLGYFGGIAYYLGRK